VSQVVDGWEIDGQVFPSIPDHPLSVDDRFRGYCGADEPTGVMIMSQNVALIQFRIPRRLQHFRVRISYHYNPARMCAIYTVSDRLCRSIIPCSSSSSSSSGYL